MQMLHTVRRDPGEANCRDIRVIRKQEREVWTCPAQNYNEIIEFCGAHFFISGSLGGLGGMASGVRISSGLTSAAAMCRRTDEWIVLINWVCSAMRLGKEGKLNRQSR